MGSIIAYISASWEFGYRYSIGVICIWKGFKRREQRRIKTWAGKRDQRTGHKKAGKTMLGRFHDCINSFLGTLEHHR